MGGKQTSRDYRAIKGTQQCHDCPRMIPAAKKRCDDCDVAEEKKRLARYNAKRRDKGRDDHAD